MPTGLHVHFNQIKNTLRSHFTTIPAVGGWVGVETEVNAKLSPTELKLELGLSLAI